MSWIQNNTLQFQILRNERFNNNILGGPQAENILKLRDQHDQHENSLSLEFSFLI